MAPNRLRMASGNFYSGTSNVVLPVKNKTFFPEAYRDKTRLCYYGSLFNSVEINSSFYRMPLARTVAKWAAEVPERFRFTFKLIQTVTHSIKRQFDLSPVNEFMARISAVGPKRGCLLVQLPPSFTIDILQLGNLLAILSNVEIDHQWPVAIEFRHSSWYCSDVYELLNSFSAGMVIHDMRKSAAPVELTSDQLVYLRFHGPEGSYRGSYSDHFLEEYASYIHEWMEDGRTVYAYFNNTMGSAVHNLMTLNEMVAYGQYT
jgi:uncharacterized protein YecE (DUF72 family)